MAEDAKTSFSQGIGSWLGTAEVYDGAGRFLGNAQDRRHVQRDEGRGRVRIDLSFVGPFKFAGHYTIADHGSHRIYEGPANVGHAEALADDLVDADCYWSGIGLSQRFFLMVLPGGQTQMSLALLSRGERLHYVVVGEYERRDDPDGLPPALLTGASIDLADDPTGGRNAVLAHRGGHWNGQLTDADGESLDYSETMTADESGLSVAIEGGVAGSGAMTLLTDQWQASTVAGSDFAGSYSLSGGRALAGTFHHLESGLRLWRREVIAHDGARKAVLHRAYRGSEPAGWRHGVLGFTPE